MIQYTAHRRRLAVVGAICLTPEGQLSEHFLIQKSGIKANDLFGFLIDLRRSYRRRLIVVWDNWSVHGKVEKGFKKLEFPWIEFERLPPYAPELNPVEFSWSQAKYHDLSNYVPPASNESWIKDIQRSFQRINRRKNLLKAFFAGAGLKIKNVK